MSDRFAPELELTLLIKESEDEDPAVLKALILVFIDKWGRDRAVRAMSTIMMLKIALDAGELTEI
jgi:hypothetical protein